MTLFSRGGDAPVELPFQDTDVVGDVWTNLAANEEGRTRCGWVEAAPVPSFDPATERVAWVGGTWAVEPLSADELAAREATTRGAAIAAVDQRAATEFLRGFAPDHPAFAGKRLQVRDVEDRTNWLTSQASYSAAVSAGLGDVPDAQFRTADNAIVTVSYSDGLAVLLAMAAWGRAIMARGWTLKDTLAAGGPIDLDTGWPQ